MNGEKMVEELLKKVGRGKRGIGIGEKGLMEEKDEGRYLGVWGEVVGMFGNEKMRGMGIVWGNIWEEEMERGLLNMGVEERWIYGWE